MPQPSLQPSQEKWGHPGKAAEAVDGGGDGVDSLVTAWEEPRWQVRPSVAPAGSLRDRPHLSDSAQASRQGGCKTLGLEPLRWGLVPSHAISLPSHWPSPRERPHQDGGRAAPCWTD